MYYVLVQAGRYVRQYDHIDGIFWTLNKNYACKFNAYAAATFFAEKFLSGEWSLELIERSDKE